MSGRSHVDNLLATGGRTRITPGLRTIVGLLRDVDAAREQWHGESPSVRPFSVADDNMATEKWLADFPLEYFI